MTQGTGTTPIDARSPEGIIVDMRKLNAALYTASWTNDDDKVIAACLIVDDSIWAERLLAFAKELEAEDAYA